MKYDVCNVCSWGAFSGVSCHAAGIAENLNSQGHLARLGELKANSVSLLAQGPQGQQKINDLLDIYRPC